jgi:hypothetical protein
MKYDPAKGAARPIEPTAPTAQQHELLDRLLATRERDLADVEAAHRRLLEAGPALHRKLLRWLARTDPQSGHLAVGLALLATGTNPAGRRFATALVEDLPPVAVAGVVDYIHGWRVDRTHTKRERKRFRDEMTAAYDATAAIVHEELRRTGIAPGEFQGGEILVTLGSYDKVQQVLDHLLLPYQTTPCAAVAGLPLRADQVLIVNCPGDFSAEGIEAVRRFVACGGTLVTTDWALHTTLERAFPGVLEYNQRPTRDDVVKVSWVHADSPYTRGVEVPGQTISWWLEGSSYPIRVLDGRATVLVGSDEMHRRYGEGALVVTFDYGEGTVVHLTIHYYLQRSQGDKSAKANAAPAPAGAVGEQILAQAAAGGPSAGHLAAAYSSMRLLANVLYEARRKCGV